MTRKKKSTKTQAKKSQRKKNFKYFIKVYEFLNDYDLTPSDKIVYGVIKNLSVTRENETFCTMSSQQLATYSNLSARQIALSLHNLDREKLISYCYHNKTNMIVLNEDKFDKAVQKKNGYIPVSANILMDNNLSAPNYKIIYSFIKFLVSRQKQNKKCYSGTCPLLKKEMCEICNISPATFYNVINFLSEKNYIKLTKVDRNDKKKVTLFADVISK